MSTNQTSTASAKGRAEQTNRPSPGKPSPRALMQGLIARLQLWFDKLASLPYARVAMIFVAGFAAGIICDSYGGGARKAIAGWSPHVLGWVAPTASSERIRSMEVALATARQSLNKLASEMSRLESQGLDAQPRRSSRQSGSRSD